MKRADHGTPLGGDPKHPKPPAPAQQTGHQPGDARGDGKQVGENQAAIEENREQLGVEENHKTDAMEKGRRGTFP